jgi:hypothetical protein
MRRATIVMFLRGLRSAGCSSGSFPARIIYSNEHKFFTASEMCI